jgi:hypothetical protein
MGNKMFIGRKAMTDLVLLQRDEVADKAVANEANGKFWLRDGRHQ